MPVRVERVVAVVVALDRRGMRAPRQRHDGAHQEPGQVGAVRVVPDDLRLDQLLGDHDHRPAGLPGRRADAGRPPRVAVAVAVRPLHVEDRDVRREGRDEDQGIPREGTRGHAQPRVPGEEIRAEQAPRRQIGDPEGRPLQGEGDREVRVILDRERARNASLERPTEGVGGTVLNVADPGGHDVADTAGGDQLIEADVGDRPDEGQVAAALSDQLVGGGERDEALERRPERDAGAVGHMAPHRLRHRHDLRWGQTLPCGHSGARSGCAGSLSAGKCPEVKV